MLTILWRKPDGAELLFEAQSLERVNKHPEPQVPVAGEFIARGIDDDANPGSTMHFDIEGPFGAVFVMNEAGATVARYMASPGITAANAA